MPTNFLFGQSSATPYFQNELSIISFNDNFLPPFSDRYYTNGLSILFSYVADGSLLNKRIAARHIKKSIIRFELGQKIYTPSSITKSNIHDLDRPYAGYLYLRSSVHSFWKHTHGLQLDLDVGIIGPKAGGEKIQKWWHDLIEYTNPNGWQYQINNVPVVNFNISFQRSWLKRNGFDMIPAIDLQTGTAFNNASAGLIIRTGKINPIDYSAITKSYLGNRYSSVANSINSREWFLFWGIKNTFVIHNSLIEGGVFSRPRSVHTERVRTNVKSLSSGFAYSTPWLTCMITVYQLSPEVVHAKGHMYGSIEMAVRF